MFSFDTEVGEKVTSNPNYAMLLAVLTYDFDIVEIFRMELVLRLGGLQNPSSCIKFSNSGLEDL